MQMRHFFPWLDGLFVLLLALYVLAGVALVPLHGDEATVIYTARDVYFITGGDLARVRYQAAPASIAPEAATEQELRLLNGTLTRYLFGLAALAAGFGRDDINDQWDWCCDLAYNTQNGHVPAPDLLRLTRTVAALLFAASSGVLFLLARRIAGRPVAYLAALYYTLNPALLLNGRRAMMESALLLGTLLLLLAAVGLLAALPRPRPARFLALGLAAGLALAAKHTAVFSILPVFISIGAALLHAIRRAWWARQPLPLRPLLWLLAAGLVALATFYVLNPAWWGDPLTRAVQVLGLRQSLLAGQTAAFGGYETAAAQAAGFLRQVFIVLPQYYEVSAWQDFIGPQIAAYEASPWRGVSLGGSVPGGIIIAALMAVGAIWLLRQRSVPPAVRGLLMVYGAVLLPATFILTPLEWQRYYLPAYPVVALFGAMGTLALLRAAWHRRPR
ncbi:MAG: glycosyltransferase family 39 protein [Anaerolineae bacterium]|jgi:4-amino-4-deoxy-L-arabinose transferase-like glycosyltransferase|nr:glycosyltransferase family 39 protein [Anaerolineae bacterium]